MNNNWKRNNFVGWEGSEYHWMEVDMGSWRQHWTQMNMAEEWTCAASTLLIWARNIDMLMLVELNDPAISPTLSLR